MSSDEQGASVSEGSRSSISCLHLPTGALGFVFITAVITLTQGPTQPRQWALVKGEGKVVPVLN
jgi:hypothetical protein